MKEEGMMRRLSLAGPKGSVRLEFTGDWLLHELEGEAVIDCSVTLSFLEGGWSCAVDERLTDGDVRELAKALARCVGHDRAKLADRFAWEPFDADIYVLFSVYGTTINLAVDLGADSGKMADLKASLSVIDVTVAEAREGVGELNEVLASLPSGRRE